MIDIAPPIPPRPFIDRVGVHDHDEAGPEARFDAVGRECRESIRSLLPTDWSFEGRQVLDFGCGAGRTVRHFVDEARAADTFWACDIHGPSIEWASAHLGSTFRFFMSGEMPPLPLDDASIDLVYAVSVFSHLADNAGAWLLELRRVLRPDGLLIATFLGPSRWETRRQGSPAPPLEDLGRHVDHYGDSFFDSHGPHVYMAPWWIREHWSRAFDILELCDGGFPLPPDKPPGDDGHGVVVMRPNRRKCNPAELEVPRPDDHHELDAVIADRAVVLAEVRHLRWQCRQLTAQVDDARARLAQSAGNLRSTEPRRSLRQRFRRTVT